MPNHVTTKLEINNQDQHKAVSEFLKSKDRQVDFNSILRMPDILLNDTCFHSGVEYAAKCALGLFPKLEEAKNDIMLNLQLNNAVKHITTPFNINDIDDVCKALQCYKETGYVYWYDWATANWDTKWNAYDSESTGNYIQFQTAWSHPEKLIKLLSEKFSDVIFKVKFADEDTGSNCGHYSIEDGAVSNKKIAPSYGKQTKEEKRYFSEFAFTLTNPDSDPKEYGYDENWEYVEE